MDLFGADSLLGFGDELKESIYKNLGGSKYLFDHSSESDVICAFLKKIGLKMLHTGEEWLTR